MTRPRHVIVIGAGAGGLAATMDLTAAGVDVTLVERAEDVGGKMRLVHVNETGINAGPTVFTMRWVFDALFQQSNASFDSELALTPADRLARHAWLDGSQLDLWADIDQSADAIAAFSNSENAKGYVQFCQDSQAIFETLKSTFINASKPGPFDLGLRIGLHRIHKLWQTRPFDTYWSRLAAYFSDPRLQQLFGRYSTYVGSSPFLTPATLMLIAHVEQDGVWLVDGGMHAVARAMRGVAERNGAVLRLGADVAKILVKDRAVTGIELTTGERIAADAVVFNGDSAALAQGLLGTDTTRAVTDTKPENRSLSALTWCAHAKVSGFDLDYHTVFFSDAYRDEFERIFQQRRVPETPTIYICAQDRGPAPQADDRDRLLILVNAPADGDRGFSEQDQSDALWQKTRAHLAQYGLTVEADAPTKLTGPNGFNTLFPGTGGALYGRANHGPFAT
ncbi:MAG: FAD-dependent oxidoreductase, partial [Pseudomonadota bacterium]